MKDTKYNGIIAAMFAGGAIIAALAPKFLLFSKLPIIGLVLAVVVFAMAAMLADKKRNNPSRVVAYAMMSYSSGELLSIVCGDPDITSHAMFTTAAAVAITYVASLIDPEWVCEGKLPRIMLLGVAVAEIASRFVGKTTLSLAAIVIEVGLAAILSHRWCVANNSAKRTEDAACRGAFLLFGSPLNYFAEALGLNIFY